MEWKVAGPSEYLAITGRGIDDIEMVDVHGHESFSYLGQKTQMEAANDQPEVHTVICKIYMMCYWLFL
jgi:hypothetical protein